MDEPEDTARQIRRFHDETPHAVRVSVTLSTETRRVLSAVRDDLNERAGEPVANTNDVVRLALEGAARYHERAPDGGNDSDLRALTASIHDAVESE
jgi:hypothetical protein